MIKNLIINSPMYKIFCFDEHSPEIFFISMKCVKKRTRKQPQGRIRYSAQDGLKAASTCGEIERERD